METLRRPARCAPAGVVLAWVLAGCLVAGCGQSAAAGPAAMHRPAVANRLARLAFAAARRAGNPHPRFAAYVAAGRGRAVAVSTGGDRTDSNEPVWMVEVVGSFPRYARFSHPPGAADTMRCVALSFTVARASWRVLDEGCGRPFALARIGVPHRLHPPRASGG